jgi:DNA-binding response OmpR family regulator
MTTMLDEYPQVDAYTQAMMSRPMEASAGATILIADDDDDVRDVIAYRLQMSGFHTLSADNGRSALNLAKERRPGLIMLDVTMPQLDGLTVCHELHANPQTAEIPVLMISSSHAAERSLDFGADDYLPKPFSQTEMLRRVNWLLMSAGR